MLYFTAIPFDKIKSDDHPDDIIIITFTFLLVITVQKKAICVELGRLRGGITPEPSPAPAPTSPPTPAPS